MTTMRRAKSNNIALADELGPKARRRAAAATVLASVLLVGSAALVLQRFADKGQLAKQKWDFLTELALWRFLLRGLRNTLTVSLVAMAIALCGGAIGAYGRLSSNRMVRVVSTLAIEGLRATPLALLIYFMGQLIPRYGPDIGSYWYLVAGLSAYNASVIAEVFRAGIRSLGTGQREAGLAVGLTEGQVLRKILFPQGVRRMLPALINQLVTLLKDSSIGALVLLPAVDDLLHQGKILGEFKKNPLQALLVVAAIYIVVNFLLSRVAVRLEARVNSR